MTGVSSRLLGAAEQEKHWIRSRTSGSKSVKPRRDISGTRIAERLDGLEAWLAENARDYDELEIRICFVRQASGQRNQGRWLDRPLKCAVSRPKAPTSGVSVQAGWRRNPLQLGRSMKVVTH